MSDILSRTDICDKSLLFDQDKFKCFFEQFQNIHSSQALSLLSLSIIIPARRNIIEDTMKVASIEM
jgi:predicted ferric reductase